MLRVIGLAAFAVIGAVAIVASRVDHQPKVESPKIDLGAVLPETVKEVDKQLDGGHVHLASAQGEPSAGDVQALRDKFAKMDYDSLNKLLDYHDNECGICAKHDGPICQEAFLILQEVMRRPEFKAEADNLVSHSQPSIDPAQIDAVNDRLTAIDQKLDQVLSKPEPLQAVFPSADEIAEKVAVKAADKIAEKVVEKIRGLLVEIKATDGTVRKEVVKTSSVAGSQPIQLNPGEVLTHIDGVPVTPAQASRVVQYGSQPSAPVYQTPAYQVQMNGRNARIVPRQGTCQMINGVRVCN